MVNNFFYSVDRYKRKRPMFFVAEIYKNFEKMEKFEKNRKNLEKLEKFKHNNNYNIIVILLSYYTKNK